MIHNRAGWLALAVLAVATLLMVFFVMPRLSGDEKPQSTGMTPAAPVVEAPKPPAPESSTPQSTTASKGAKPQAEAKQEVLPAPEKAATAPASPAPQKAVAPVIIPTFDVLRVEPDGSTVIAGRAAPGARLEVTDQAHTVATTTVDKAGEFVAILDKPLSPGDHQLVLKATTPDGKTVISEEIATVSVPRGKETELLAMVTKPGEASRIIAKPAASAKTDPVATTAPDASSAQLSTEPAKPAPQVMNAPSAQPSTDPQLPTVAAPATGTTAPAQQSTSTQALATPATEPSDAAKANLQISAVEVEGNKLFVAGVAKPGSRLKGYADGQLIGQTTAGGDGSFVIDGVRELTVGQHTIAVDQIGADDKVIVRVEVPFNRPAGDQVAAVASQQNSAASLTQIDAGAFDKLRNEVAKAFQLLQNLYANNATPSMEQVAAAHSAVSISLRSLTEYRLPAGISANAAAIADTTIKAAADALAALEALPKDVEAIRKNLETLSAMIARVTSSTLQSAPATAQATPTVTIQDAAAPRTIAQAPLTQSEAASVIIRRGDTLWQISRRVYGQGVRYTTIYLANQDQIANPDLIQPGQIFGVPKDAMPETEAEKLHRQRLNKT
ncbi:LysM peptidoglycan-binding domain-containing protein [Rhizobium lemnae]|uniref:LysM peptidoglycan-binding domain-containing protein n=1 Tax=Rhizobium lemnae TaxID=1214924 RepID=A0ABV8E9Y1_9HYPH|nr:LysM peptidoglycan-binding domain-containing protein [Rhizobium lemnae]MCJ8508178.1 LysM peptidoglycan-binding domain-containing protein [Rhizobium lemnae]